MNFRFCVSNQRSANQKALFSYYILIFFFLNTHIYAQNKFGIKVGAGTYDVLSDSVTVLYQGSTSTLKLIEAKTGYFVGTVAQFNRKGLVLQPELFYHYNQVIYSFNSLSSPNFNQVLIERNHSLGALCLLGTKAGPLRLNFGPIAYVMLNNETDLKQIPGFSIQNSSLLFGYQAGLGVDVWRLLIDLRYESYFQPFGNHLLFENKNIHFNDTAKRLVASIAILF
jgi:hypothetical protein